MKEFDILSNSKGVFVSIEHKLRNHIQQLYDKGALNYLENNNITIKLCCDGTNISKKTTVYNVSFSIINEKMSCKTASGHYLIGTFEISEKYDELKIALKEIVEELNSLTTVRIVNGNSTTEFTIIKKFSSDLKATSMLMGVNLANANYPCPFCKFRFLGKKAVSYNEVELYVQDLKKNWDLDDETVSRSQKESKVLINKKQAEERKGDLILYFHSAIDLNLLLIFYL